MKPMRILGLLACLCAGSAAAQQGPATRFEATTGPVTVVSVQPPIANAADYRASLAELDANGDGVLKRRELPESHALFHEFRLVDHNSDGRVTETELANWK